MVDQPVSKPGPVYNNEVRIYKLNRWLIQLAATMLLSNRLLLGYERISYYQTIGSQLKPRAYILS